MSKPFMMRLDMIQPSQLYICTEKLEAVMQILKANPRSMEPIPIKKLGNEIIFVDGHTRAFAAYLRGETEVKVYWEDEELDWDAYAICVGWCKKEGIRTIADLKNRIVNEKEYEELWLNRCEEMQRGLKLKSEKL
ncbi:MAG: hypothetical protein QXJ02_04575 [Candidatus Bathyarchaeia archaeon]